MSNATIRQWHSYVGLFIAPSVLFFALTGALQLFSLHESHGDYRPAAFVEKLSSVHKDQVFALGDHHPPGPPERAAAQSAGGMGQPGGAGPRDGDGDKGGVATLMLKIYFMVIAVGLSLSSVLGLWMGLTQMRRARTAWLLVMAGTLIPVGLLLV